MNWPVDIGFLVLGMGLIFLAVPLSVRYNAWTTRLRTRNPNLSPPPTPEWRARNTKIMTFIFRFAGAFFLLRVVLDLIARPR